MNNHIGLSELTLVESDGVHFYTVTATGDSGISFTGLSVLCGVSRTAISKLLKSLQTRAVSAALSNWVGQEILVCTTSTGMKIIKKEAAITIVKHYYQLGKATETGAKLINMPVIIKKRKSQQTEKAYVRHLQEVEGGEMEVLTESGSIDLLTLTQLIEVKQVKSWKAGLGQLLVYSVYYPSHQLRLHVFGKCHSSYLEIVQRHCERFGILVTWEP